MEKGTSKSSRRTPKLTAVAPQPSPVTSKRSTGRIKPRARTPKSPLMPSSTGDIPEGMAMMIVMEYESLRREIDLYHEHQKEFMNFDLLLTVGMFSLLGAFLTLPSTRTTNLKFTFLLFPLIFTLLSLFYTDRTIRIIRIADYLHNHLRPKANQLTGQKVLQWELYKRNTRLFHRGLTLFLDRARWLTFIFPSLLAVMIFLVIHTDPWLPLEIILLVIDTIAIFSSFLIMFVTEETSGIASLARTNLDDLS